MSGVRVDREKYTAVTYINGVRIKERDTVTDREGVMRWLASAEYFDNLVQQDGQPPEVHKKLRGGVIVTTRFNPTGDKYVTIFMPV